MKFPHKISKERLSLLSEEDRKIYEYEHSGLYPVETPVIDDNVGYIEEDAQIRKQLDQFLFESEFDNMFDKDIIEIVGEDEYTNIKKNLFDFIENDPEMKGELFEAPGHSPDWWMDFKLGWLGKLAAGLLTGLLGVVAWLLMKGKDRLAMKKLKQYMNKLVELIDQGVNKKRPWYSFLMISKKKRQNNGDYNKECFRTIQETAERNMACLYTQCIHNLGFLSPDLTDFRGITSGMVPMEGSGLDNFRNAMFSNVAQLQILDDQRKPLSSAESDSKALAQFLPIMPSPAKFNSLKLPALPTNYTMLMCNIEYPAKADKNPNGSLFMKPTQEILQAKAEDLGQVYFNQNLDVHQIIHYKDKTDESLDYISAFNNPYIQMLLEADEKNKTDQESTALRKSSPDFDGGLLNNDIDPTEQLGGELNVNTEGKRETKVQHFEGNIIEAIDGYMRSSVPVVQKLVKAICGNQQSRDVGTFEQIMTKLIAAAEGTMQDFMSENDEELKKYLGRDKNNQTVSQLKTHTDAVQQICAIAVWAAKDVNKFGTILQQKGFYDRIDDIKDKICDDNDKGTYDLDILLKNKLGGLTFNKIQKFIEGKGSKLYDSKQYINVDLLEQPINEDDKGNIQFLSGAGNDSDLILDKLEKSLDKTYNEVRNHLSEKLSSAINSDPSTWYIITSSRTRMEKLKEAADNEINAKIKLICRIAAEGKTDIGDKFKSAISKHPMRAEGLTRLWAMYSGDLTDRMESRIRSITGDNGNSNILTTIKQFLLNVYPNLVAIMLFYKQMYFLINLYTRKYPIEKQFYQYVSQQQDKISQLISIANIQMNCKNSIDAADAILNSSTN